MMSFSIMVKIIHFGIYKNFFFKKEDEESSNAPLKEEGKTQKEDIYESIHKYTFYEYDDDWVRYSSFLMIC